MGSVGAAPGLGADEDEAPSAGAAPGLGADEAPPAGAAPGLEADEDEDPSATGGAVVVPGFFRLFKSDMTTVLQCAAAEK